jgi:TolB-like protein
LLSAVVVASIAVLAGLAVWRFYDPPANAGIKEIRSIAILPLTPISKTENDQSFSLGLTDSLITRLGRLNKFAVRPFTAVEKFRESGKDAVEFARQLKADAVLEGNVQQASGRLRVSVRVIDVRDGTHIWSDNFDETETDILKLQDAISNRVSRVLLAKLDPLDEDLLAKGPTANPEAYRLYLAGRERWLQRNWRAESIAFYQKAIDLDPNFALPHLGIADEYAFTHETSIAESALIKAVELDPQLAEAHATRGFLQMFHHWDWPGAEASLRRAIELAPNSSKAHHWYGVYLSIRGRLDEARREMEIALELDPTASIISTDLAEIYYFKREYGRAESELLKVIQSDPTFLNARLHLAKVRYKNGGSYFLEEAAFNVFLQQRRKADRLGTGYDTGELESIVARGNEKKLRDDTEKFGLKEAKSRPELYLALSRLYSITGEKATSLDALEKAVEAKVFTLPFIAVDPLFDPLRNDPRFRLILQRMSLDV